MEREADGRTGIGTKKKPTSSLHKKTNDMTDVAGGFDAVS